MSMYVPLFSAAVAKYAGAPDRTRRRLISLDEAFAGVDETNIRDMFRLMAEFEFDFIINSQVSLGRLRDGSSSWRSISWCARKTRSYVSVIAVPVERQSPHAGNGRSVMA